MKTPTIVLVSVSTIFFIVVGLVALKRREVHNLWFKYGANEQRDWYYFPIVDSASGIRIPMSYAPVVDWYGYNEKQISVAEPESLDVQWSFRHQRSVKRYGFVLRRWPFEQKIDNSSARILWLNEDEMNTAIREGEIRVPRINTLPKFSLEDL